MMTEQPTVEAIVARIVRAHGVRGEVVVESRTDEPERRFVPGVHLRATRAPDTDAGTIVTLATARAHQGRWLLAFDEIGDRTQAEAWTGAVLVARVPADETPVAADEFYDRQLIGLTVLRHDGTAGGTVVRVDHPGAQDLLVVDTPAGERLVPFVAALVPDVDLVAGTLRLADVAGLLEDEPSVSAASVPDEGAIA